jgi:hypothetical protein
MLYGAIAITSDDGFVESSLRCCGNAKGMSAEALKRLIDGTLYRSLCLESDDGIHN